MSFRILQRLPSTNFTWSVLEYFVDNKGKLVFLFVFDNFFFTNMAKLPVKLVFH